MAREKDYHCSWHLSYKGILLAGIPYFNVDVQTGVGIKKHGCVGCCAKGSYGCVDDGTPFSGYTAAHRRLQTNDRSAMRVFGGKTESTMASDSW